MLPSYLRKRGRIYYLRLRVPADLTGEAGRAEIWKSLHTPCKMTAQQLALRLAAAAERFFRRLRAGMPLDFDRINEILEREAQIFWIATDEMRALPEFDLTESQLRANMLKLTAEFRDALDRRDYELCADRLDALIARYGLAIEKGSSEYRHFGRLFMLSRVRAYEVEARRTLGDFDPANPVDRTTKPDVFRPRLPEITPAPPPAPVLALPAKKVKRLSAVIDLMLEDRDHLKEKTRKEYEGHKPFVLKLLGDLPVTEYEREHFVKVRKVLQKWPKKANSIPSLAEEPIEEILQRTDLGHVYAERTVRKYLIFIANVFNYAETRGFVPRSYAQVPRMSEALEEDDGWQPWEPEHLIALFQSRYYSNPKVRQQKPQHFWVPLISMYSGMRLNEVCQLYAGDLVQVDGIWVFDVNRLEDKQLKTKWSRRQVPIHPLLMELGLLEYVQRLDHPRLWPQLKKGKNGSGYSTGWGKSMQKHVRRNVTEDDDIVFHGLRNNFGRAIKRTRNGDSVAVELLGHKREFEVTAGYTGTYPLDFLQEVVRQVDHGVDPREHIRG